MLTLPELIDIDYGKCDQCYACVRNCPVKAIYVRQDDHQPVVKHNRCIGCGICVEACRPGAISYYSSVKETRELLSAPNEKVAIVSPSISAEFDDITDFRKFVKMIKSLGFTEVYDLSFGIDLVARRYKDFFDNFRGRYYLTSCDPVVVGYIEKYHPSLVNNLIPIVSPKIAMTKVIRQKHPEDTTVVYIGPDIASKTETLRYEGNATINVAITFKELRQLFKEYNIDESALDYSDFGKPYGYKGLLFPVTNGMVQAAFLDEDLLASRIFSIEGVDTMKHAIDEFEKSVKVIHRNLHIMSGTALSGPGLSKKGKKLYKEYLVIKYAQKRLKDFDKEEWEANVKAYDEMDLSTNFTPNDQRLPQPPKEKIREALDKLRAIKGREANCTRCGYESCNAFAIDMANGIVTAEMCATYTLRYSQKYDQTVVELQDKIDKMSIALRESEEKVMEEHESVVQTSEITSAMIEKLRAGIVIVDMRLKVVMANKTFANILGEEALEIYDIIPGLKGADLNKLLTPEICQLFSYVLEQAEPIDGRDVSFGDKLLNISIFSFKENNIAGAIVRDMGSPEVQKAEAVKRINEVINKNLEMTQQIGFLLGEGASDVERMLNSIIEFYETDNKNPK